MSIRSRLEDRPWYRLTAHFFLGLFDFGLLSDAGSDACRRVLIGIVAVMLTFGLLLVRMSMGKYAALSEIFTRRGPYRLAVIGDDALTIAIPMVVVGLTTLLVSDSLFPDETDFRVLLTLPISRRVVFLSKLLALVLFTGLFIAATHAAMVPLVLTMSISRWSDQGVVLRLIAYGLASVGASVFVVLALTAIRGLLLVCVPRARLQTASMAFRSAMLCALVLSIPLVARLPAIGPLVAGGSRPLLLVPPIWFLGVERLLLGSATPYVARLAQIAAVAFAAASAIALGTYAFLYRRFDRVILRPAAGADGRSRRHARPRARREPRRPGFAAISAFTHLTLARSALHQGVFVAIAACGAGLALNSFIGAEAIPRLQTYEQALTHAAVWSPFALMFAMTLAVKAALVLPIEPRANWVFRMTEDPASRVDQLNAVVGTVVRLGVVAPLAILFPVEWAMFGVRSLLVVAVALPAGLVLVEAEMGEWQRIPYTCSYMPGKRFVGLTALIGFAAFVAFTSIGSGLAWYGRGHPAGALVVTAILAAIVLERRRRRHTIWRETALVFEDVLPSEIEPLRLSAY